MPNLNYLANVLDAETGKYVNGFEYNGDGLIHFASTAQGAEFGLNLANQELMRRNLPMSALVNTTTITLGGIAWGSGGTNAVAATGVLTATGLPTAADTITIGTGAAEKVYTWVNTLTPLAYEVLIDQSVSQTLVAPAPLTLEAGGNAVSASLLSALAISGDALDGGAAEVITINGDDDAGDPIEEDTVRVDSGNTVATLLTAIETFFGGGTASIASGVITYTAPAGASLRTLTLAFEDAEATGTTTYDDLPLEFEEGIAGSTASVTDTLNNLVAAINAGAGSGTTYGGGTAHTKVTAARSGSTVVVTAIIPGEAGNLEATTDDSDNMSWGAETLEGGADAES